MTNLTEANTFDAGVYEWQTTDPVQGGAGGVAIEPIQNLTNRTRWLYNQVNTLATEIAVLAPINSPNFTGSPTVPNVAAGDNSTKAINSAFLWNALNGIANINCAGAANIVLTAAQYGCGTINLVGAVTAPINVIFPSQFGSWIIANYTTGSPVTCKTAGAAGFVVAQGTASGVYCDGTKILDSKSDFTRVGNLTVSGTATGVTPPAGDNSNQFATTAFAAALAAVRPTFSQIVGAIAASNSSGSTESISTSCSFTSTRPCLIKIDGSAGSGAGGIYDVSLSVSGATPYIITENWSTGSSLGVFSGLFSTASAGELVTITASALCSPASIMNIGLNVTIFPIS